MRTILAQEGLRGMYAGYSSFLLRDLPFDAIEFFSYEQGKTLWKAAVGGRELTPGGCGWGVAPVIAALWPREAHMLPALRSALVLLGTECQC